MIELDEKKLKEMHGTFELLENGKYGTYGTYKYREKEMVFTAYTTNEQFEYFRKKVDEELGELE